MGTLRLLEAIKICGLMNKVKFYQVEILGIEFQSFLPWKKYFSSSRLLISDLFEKFCFPFYFRLRQVSSMEKYTKYLKLKPHRFIPALHMVFVFLHKYYQIFSLISVIPNAWSCTPSESSSFAAGFSTFVWPYEGTIVKLNAFFLSFKFSK